jgi:hypothetical protein
MNSLLELRGISAGYNSNRKNNGKAVLDNIDLSVKKRGVIGACRA